MTKLEMILIASFFIVFALIGEIQLYRCKKLQEKIDKILRPERGGDR